MRSIGREGDGNSRSPNLDKSSGILVKKHRQDRLAHHDVGEPVRVESAHALAIAICSLLVAGSIGCLIRGGGDGCYGENDRVGAGLLSQLKF